MSVTDEDLKSWFSGAIAVTRTASKKKTVAYYKEWFEKAIQEHLKYIDNNKYKIDVGGGERAIKNVKNFSSIEDGKLTLLFKYAGTNQALMLIDGGKEISNDIPSKLLGNPNEFRKLAVASVLLKLKKGGYDEALKSFIRKSPVSKKKK